MVPPSPHGVCAQMVRRLVCQWGVRPMHHVHGLDSFAQNNDRTGFIFTTLTNSLPPLFPRKEMLGPVVTPWACTGRTHGCPCTTARSTEVLLPGHRDTGGWPPHPIALPVGRPTWHLADRRHLKYAHAIRLWCVRMWDRYIILRELCSTQWYQVLQSPWLEGRLVW